jgi:hypothetical protein
MKSSCRYLVEGMFAVPETLWDSVLTLKVTVVDAPRIRVTLGKTDARTAHGKLYFYDTISTTLRFEPSPGRGGSNQIGSLPTLLRNLLSPWSPLHAIRRGRPTRANMMSCFHLFFRKANKKWSISARSQRLTVATELHAQTITHTLRHILATHHPQHKWHLHEFTSSLTSAVEIRQLLCPALMASQIKIDI